MRDSHSQTGSLDHAQLKAWKHTADIVVLPIYKRRQIGAAGKKKHPSFDFYYKLLLWCDFASAKNFLKKVLTILIFGFIIQTIKLNRWFRRVAGNSAFRELQAVGLQQYAVSVNGLMRAVRKAGSYPKLSSDWRELHPLSRKYVCQYIEWAGVLTLIWVVPQKISSLLSHCGIKGFFYI